MSLNSQIFNYAGLIILASIGSYAVYIGSQKWIRYQARVRRARQMPIEPLLHHDWRSEKPRQLRPFKPTYNITMGIQQDSFTARQFMGFVRGGEEATYELYSYLLTHHLPSRFPGLFKIHNNVFENHITGANFPAEPPHDPDYCLRVLAETVEEDIFLLQETESTHVCLAFACCHPAGFDPSAKLGADLKAIHGPVPHFEKIGPSMERYFRKLEVGKSVKRVNWNIQIGTDITNIAGNHIKEGDTFVSDEAVNCEEGFLRCELQSLTRLPETKFILFSFKTYMYPLGDIKAEGSGPELADAIDGLLTGNAPGLNKYKGAVRWGKGVKDYLRS
ncbi:hypothetical protein N7468_007344 [Penicillium chermesinum]|uniref:Uncharacterized protein n=1 Tax=Penicillium chermesinum TaxID=63820 RepID=A0A9W9NWV2_9EURO|nr:uncharacterized protein N7468_007344 [Penicillium chermesinum]KAJ5226119.1 hypothetical protein N7468_007344 [Penicillium chermesinum]